MSILPEHIETLATKVIKKGAEKGVYVATAESCTGGLIGGSLTDIAGSSAVVDRGFITYTNKAKMQVLGVSADTLREVGAVSERTACEMANGAIAKSASHLAVAVTGIAGPGGSDHKPGGRVHLATANRDGIILHKKMDYGDIGRDKVRLATIETALEMLLSALEEM
ncbi:nicotinamide-nucleotide amidohydrolase family protein [Sneathiella sp. P13V-1]|uniref:CinA family protein n=1 Tax=Sneathiella sp. P13V-1 TaxID=2697366 RepID=UPI00187B8121|nr:CinA family protein [Sneathiella sp. P13V-1]MBE7637319.1 nicotinamide-nucleotide amidohydrolase family protein [Sneathiella sp. P13V-1]